MSEASAPTSDAQNDTGPLLIGGTFANRYVVQSHLGCGGMGHVYEVQDEELSERVALKVLARPIDDGAALQKFRDEVRLARMVTHKNVARTYDIGVDAGKRFITMELVSGLSLRKTLRVARALQVERAATIAGSVAEGLAAAHDVGVVHRDLKPGNVLLERSGRIVLIDFGVARALSPGRAADGEAAVDGTLDYMAPEQLAGEPSDYAVDVYALGLILFEALAGERAFFGAKATERAVQRLRQPAPDLRSRAGVSDDVADLVARCLQRDPAQRPSARDVARALEAMREAAGPAGLYDDVLDRPVSGDDELPDSKRASGAMTPCLAVMPFRTDSDARNQGIATALLGGVLDGLYTARGVRVIGVDQMLDGAAVRSSRVVGQELGACYLVSGNVHESGDRLRVSARVFDVERGMETWTDDIDVPATQVVEAQDRIARGIGEAIQIERTAQAADLSLPADAVPAWLIARQLARAGSGASSVESLAAIERCLAVAPGYGPATALRALVASSAWLGASTGDGVDWASETRRSVAAALAGAALAPELHVAAAHLALQEGRAGDAARAYRQALALAPAFAPALEGRGRLEIEAGLVHDGARSLRHAVLVDPGCATSLLLIARACAMRGRHDEYARALARVERKLTVVVAEQLRLQARVAWWGGDPVATDAAIARLPVDDPTRALLQPVREAMSASAVVPLQALVQARLDELQGACARPRAAMHVHQLAAEISAKHDVEAGLRHVEAAAAGVLVDVEWMDRCPALAPLRWDPRFADARDVVAARAAEVAAVT